MTNYKAKYEELMNTVLDNAGKIPAAVVTKAQVIHSRQEDTTEQEKPVTSKKENKITADQFNNMSYLERVELKKSSPETYDNAVAGNFKESE